MAQENVCRRKIICFFMCPGQINISFGNNKMVEEIYWKIFRGKRYPDEAIKMSLNKIFLLISVFKKAGKVETIPG